MKSMDGLTAQLYNIGCKIKDVGLNLSETELKPSRGRTLSHSIMSQLKKILLTWEVEELIQENWVNFGLA